MTKKYFMTIESARRFCKKKKMSPCRVFSTSHVWQKKDKRRARKNYLVKW